MAGFGASRPLRRAPTKVRLLSRLPTLDLAGGDYSSCPSAVIQAKTAYSPLLKVAGDYSCGIFDARGNMVAQGPDLPIHLGSMPDAVRAVITAFPVVEPGDMYIHNDPYNGGALVADV